MSELTHSEGKFITENRRVCGALAIKGKRSERLDSERTERQAIILALAVGVPPKTHGGIARILKRSRPEGGIFFRMLRRQF